MVTSAGLKKPSSGQYVHKNLKFCCIYYKTSIFEILYTFISGLYNDHQTLDVISVVSCVEILYCDYCGCISKIFIDLQP